jgi:hypothetical protein
MDTSQVTTFSSLGLVFTLAMVALSLALPRRLALLPIVFTACYMTFGQQIVIAGLHFRLLRLLVLVGCIRIIFRGELRGFRWQRLDTVITLWSISSIVTYTLLWQTPDALVNRIGLVFDAFGLYFAFRCFVRDLDDIQRACHIFAIVLVPLAVSMCIEKLTGRNPFYVFGGVPEFTSVREGVLRCQGPFGHPILAGTFGAVWVPCFVGLWWQGRNRLLALIGIVSSTLITFLAGSSGPVGAYLAGIVALSFWPFRNSMRRVRWTVVGLMLLLQLVMKAPIWFVFARFSFFSGSTGWHRANLIDQTISHFFDWWLLGAKETYSWGVWGGDITNQFILEGVRGGLVTMVLFTAVVVICFSRVGRMLRASRLQPKSYQLFLWALGATVFSHVVSFLNVSYFDQNIVNWYLLLAAISAAGVSVKRMRLRNELPLQDPQWVSSSIQTKPLTVLLTRSEAELLDKGQL